MPYWLRLLCPLLLLLSACVVSPQPSPPNLSPETVSFVPPGAADQRSGVLLEGGQGAVEPAIGSIVVTNLDADSAPSSEPVQSDGSFAVTALGARERDVLRLMVREGSLRSEPVDLEISDLLEGTLSPVVHPLEDELLLTPTGQLEAIGPVGVPLELTVQIDNLGADPVALAMRLREAGSPWTLLEAPQTVDAGGSVLVRLGATPGPGISESVLLVEASGPAADRRALTLFLTGTP